MDIENRRVLLTHPPILQYPDKMERGNNDKQHPTAAALIGTKKAAYTDTKRGF